VTGCSMRRPSRKIGVGVGIGRARFNASDLVIVGGTTRPHAMRRLTSRRGVGKAGRAFVMRTRIIALLARWPAASRLGRILARVDGHSVVVTMQSNEEAPVAGTRHPDRRKVGAFRVAREVPTSSVRPRFGFSGVAA
jgi:hypothetical protein